jgi:hypothetical protein
LPEQNGELDKHFTTVLLIVPACYCSLLHEAIDEFYRAVMAQAEPFRKRPDGGTASHGQSFYGQEGLVLLRFDAPGPGGLFAYVQELADAIAELGKPPESRSRNLSAACSRVNVLAAGNH